MLEADGAALVDEGVDAADVDGAGEVGTVLERRALADGEDAASLLGVVHAAVSASAAQQADASATARIGGRERRRDGTRTR